MTQGKPTPRELVAEMRRLRREKFTVRRIAFELGCNKSTVVRHTKRRKKTC